MKILQINTDRRSAAMDALQETAGRRRAEVILISEPNKAIARKREWFMDECEDACTVVRKEENVAVTRWGKGKGFVWI